MNNQTTHRFSPKLRQHQSNRRRAVSFARCDESKPYHLCAAVHFATETNHSGTPPPINVTPKTEDGKETKPDFKRLNSPATALLQLFANPKK